MFFFSFALIKCPLTLLNLNGEGSLYLSASVILVTRKERAKSRSGKTEKQRETDKIYETSAGKHKTLLWMSSALHPRTGFSSHFDCFSFEHSPLPSVRITCPCWSHNPLYPIFRKQMRTHVDLLFLKLLKEAHWWASLAMSFCWKSPTLGNMPTKKKIYLYHTYLLFLICLDL